MIENKTESLQKFVKEGEELVEKALEALTEFEATGVRSGFKEWLKAHERYRIMKGE